MIFTYKIVERHKSHLLCTWQDSCSLEMHIYGLWTVYVDIAKELQLRKVHPAATKQRMDGHIYQCQSHSELRVTVTGHAVHCQLASRSFVVLDG